MRVLVTGGAGFIGSHLVRALHARGDVVSVLDCFDDAYSPARKEQNLAGLDLVLHRADLRDLDAVCAAVEEVDAVVHLAARAGVRESLIDPLLYESVNVRGTAVLLEALRLAGQRRGRPIPLVFASSSSVYGAQPAGGRFVEDHGADAPVSPYAATKRAGEMICHAAWAGWGVPVTCLRFFTVYGPRQRPAMAIAKFVRLARAGAPLPIFGDGGAVRDFTYVSDAVAAVMAALDRPDGFRVLNIGSDAPVRLAELVDAIESAVGRDIVREHLPVQPGDVPHTHADVSRAKATLGWAPAMTLTEGLRRYVAWVEAGEP